MNETKRINDEIAEVAEEFITDTFLRKFATRAVLLGFAMTKEGFNGECISENNAPENVHMSVKEEEECLINTMKIPQFVTLLEKTLVRLGCRIETTQE